MATTGKGRREQSAKLMGAGDGGDQAHWGPARTHAESIAEPGLGSGSDDLRQRRDGGKSAAKLKTSPGKLLSCGACTVGLGEPECAVVTE